MQAAQTRPATRIGRPPKYDFDSIPVGGQFVVDDPILFGSVRTLASTRSAGTKGFSCARSGRVLIVTRYR